MKKNDKPNGVLFKRDDGQLIVVLIEDGKWNWENILHLNMNNLDGSFEDLSSANPFEFVFINWKETSFDTVSEKTSVPDNSFLSLHDKGQLKNTIEKDYVNQYGSI